MRIVMTHRIELKPNKLQEALFRQCIGASRFAYNWALAEWQRQVEAGKKPNEAALRRQFNVIKPVEFPWILDLPKAVPQQAIKNVGRAYQRFFQQQAKSPRFKKREVHDSTRRWRTRRRFRVARWWGWIAGFPVARPVAPAALIVSRCRCRFGNGRAPTAAQNTTAM